MSTLTHCKSKYLVKMDPSGRAKAPPVAENTIGRGMTSHRPSVRMRITVAGVLPRCAKPPRCACWIPSSYDWNLTLFS